MIKKLIILSLTLVFSISFMNAQSSETESKLNEVFLEYSSSMSIEEKLNWESFLSRCTIIDITEVPEGVNIKNITDLALITKYGATLDYDTSYDPSSFNPLKYLINFSLNRDQYYRIGETTSILKIEKNL